MERVDAVHAVAELSCHDLPEPLRAQRQTVSTSWTALYANVGCQAQKNLPRDGSGSRQKSQAARGQKHCEHLYRSLLTVLQCFGHGLRDGSVTAPPVLLVTQTPIGVGEVYAELLYTLPALDQILLLGRGLRVSQD
jgi:hypothetical protein